MIIRYDLRQKKILVILTLVSLCMMVAGLLIAFLKFEALEVICPLLDIVGFVMLIYCGLNALSANIYLKELKSHGFEVPYDKRVYDSRMDKLPRDQKIYDMASTEGVGCCQDSINLAIIYAIIFACLLAWDVWFYNRWSIVYEKNVTIFLVIFDFVWLIYAIRFYRQADNAKYRSAVELDNKRVARIAFTRGIAYVFIIGVITFLVKNTAFSMTEYVYRSRLAMEQNFICDIQNSFAASYKELEDGAAITAELSKGIELCSSDLPAGEFYKHVANGLMLDSLAGVKEKLRISPDTASIIVKLEDGKVVVYYKNPAKYVDQFIKSDGKANERWTVS